MWVIMLISYEFYTVKDFFENLKDENLTHRCWGFALKVDENRKLFVSMNRSVLRILL